MKLKTLALLPLALLALTACGGDADSDRKGGGGSNPDGLEDTSNVVVYRNADNVPNVAYFCTGEFGWASTLSGTDSGGSKSASLQRFEDYDSVCAGTASEPTPEPR